MLTQELKFFLRLCNFLSYYISYFLPAWIGGFGRSVKTKANLERAYSEILLGTDLGKRVRTIGKPRVAIGNLDFGA